MDCPGLPSCAIRLSIPLRGTKSETGLAGVGARAVKRDRGGIWMMWDQAAILIGQRSVPTMAAIMIRQPGSPLIIDDQDLALP